MEKQLDGDEVIVEIPGGEHKSNTSDQCSETEANDPLTPATNTEVFHLDQDQGLRSRKKMSSCTNSSGIETPNSHLYPTPQQVDVVQSQYPKPILTESATFSTWKKENDEVILILSKTIDKLENMEIWIFDLWEWCVLLLAILCGRFLSTGFMNVILLLTDNQFLVGMKVRYVTRSLRKSIGVFIWIGLILLTWELFINRGVRKSRGTSKVVKYITRGIASTLVVAGFWIPRTLLVKFINSSIYVRRYVDRINEDMFHYYILETLSGPALMEGSENINGSKLPSRKFRFTSSTKEEQMNEKVIDVLDVPNSDSIISVWTIKQFLKVVRGFDFPNSHGENGAYAIFKNVAKPGHKYITKDDLLRFMNEDEVKALLKRIVGDRETIPITNKSFRNWVRDASMNHKGLVLSIIDTKSAIKELNKFVTGITVVVFIIIWLIITRIATREVLLFISSQFLLAIFTFGASAKSTVEAIIFVFVKYPFEAGDRCLIDGVQVMVEEVNILTTVFLKYDNEKIYYPNSELASKAISNFNRSPDMGDFVDFDLDVSTSNEIISALKAKIKGYIDGKPEFWYADHNIRVLEIQDVNKMKMRLCVTHTINFQYYGKRNQRISELVEELKKFFEELAIKYHFLSPRSLHDATF
uniref:mechanosensitive ion channel protein 10-like n=1 Tax=Erigeron canadensis TaxID=72917 RepID=UPI001CB98316|nr:mechanosensitive ion channel protein 10-like [Erigeron canadensis]